MTNPRLMAAMAAVEASGHLQTGIIGDCEVTEDKTVRSPRSMQEMEIHLASCTVTFYDSMLAPVATVVLGALLENGTVSDQGWKMTYGVVCKGGDVDRPILLQP